MWPRVCSKTTHSAASGVSSGSSRSSKTRSADAAVLCSTFMMLATCVIGIVNWREYWMNAWTSPSEMRPVGDHQPADHGDGHVVEVHDEVHDRHDDPGDELGLEARLVELLVLLVERVDGGLSGGRTP